MRDGCNRCCSGLAFFESSMSSGCAATLRPFELSRALGNVGSQIGDLLRKAQDAARDVKARSLGPIGPEAFGDTFDAHIVTETMLRVGSRESFADVPVLIEAWASVTSRKGGDASLRV
jgi:hypothetical protein